MADIERVAREVQLLKLIRHPHVVQLYEIIETKASAPMKTEEPIPHSFATNHPCSVVVS